MERRVRKSENPCWELEARGAWIQRERTFGATGNVGTETSGGFSLGACGVVRALGRVRGDFRSFLPWSLQGRAGAWAAPWPAPQGAPGLGCQGGAGLGHAPWDGALEAGPAHWAPLLLRSGAHSLTSSPPSGLHQTPARGYPRAGPELVGAEAAAASAHASPSALVLTRLPRLQAAFTPQVGAGHVRGGRRDGVTRPARHRRQRQRWPVAPRSPRPVPEGLITGRASQGTYGALPCASRAAASPLHAVLRTVVRPHPDPRIQANCASLPSLHCPSPRCICEALSPGPQNVTLLENWAIADGTRRCEVTAEPSQPRSEGTRLNSSHTLASRMPSSA